MYKSKSANMLGTSHNSNTASSNTKAYTSPFSLSSLAVDISPHHSSPLTMSGTPEWLSSSVIPMTSPTLYESTLEQHEAVMKIFNQKQHHDEEEPQWLTNNNHSDHEDEEFFAVGDLQSIVDNNNNNTDTHPFVPSMDSQHENHPSSKAIDNSNAHHHHHHSLEQYVLYSEEYDEGVLLSESHLFRQMIQPTAEKRRVGINNIVQLIIKHAKLWKETNYSNDDSTSSSNDDEDLHPAKFFERYSGLISRFAYECPFEDVSSAFIKLIDDLERDYGIKCIQKADKHNGFIRAVSHFFSPTIFKPIFKLASSSDTHHFIQNTKEHFKNIFIENGVVPHVSQVLFAHPSFAEIYYKTYNFVMKSNGPLPLDWRCYISIFAASRHNCKYLVRRLEAEFLLYGGDSKWLQGIEFIPPKLKKLVKLNSILCHMPWMVTEELISELVSNKGADDSGWTIAELVHAITIMCHFFSLPGLIFGTGILPDDDTTPVSDIQNSSIMDNEEVRKRQKNETQKLVETLTKHDTDDDTPIDKNQRNKAFESTESEATDSSSKPVVPTHLYSNLNNFDCFSRPHFASMTFWEAQHYQAQHNERSRTASTEGLIPESSIRVPLITSASTIKKSTTNRQHLLKTKKYKHNKYDFTYKDFDVKSKTYETASIYDFNWEENAYSIISRFYHGAADLLDAEFEFIYNMTDNRCDDIKDVDTSAFRAAIWCYVHRLYGVSHDDFNYEKVNKLLNIDLKKYIKTIVCYPERCTKEQFIDMGVKLRTKEKIHICLLAVEARKQVGLIYGLKAINNYMQ
ncbi:hypothetical protein C9374_003360 [Naegleria lovaniensis]|uniref:Sestrin-like protein n=1 Tax=Naegleria lovaniensis TaxID=51637 RepID=A0AA88GRI4_NAELO|nr:uncharacterized protein C9374_003360 [Naegleria lovaniensis]KAG2385545.1 hypothetical protein C9374_003360 [Naegleria lovaniensis]